MLVLKNIKKSYGENSILENINLDIPKGKLTTLLGQNGAGKSTLLRLISGQEFSNSGTIRFEDELVTNIHFKNATELIYINELIDFFIKSSSEDFALNLSKKYKRYDHQIFQKIMKKCKIDTTKNYQEFSRGQRMQFLLAHGLACRPKMLLLDEITSVIDVYARKFFLDALRSYCDAGGSVLITTNIINELEFYTDHLIILKDKNIALNGTSEEVMKKFIKIRKPTKDNDHKIFQHPQCVWSNSNSDRSNSYLLPVEIMKEENIPKELIDRRASTLEDLFIYYFNNLNEEEENHEVAA